MSNIMMKQKLKQIKKIVRKMIVIILTVAGSDNSALSDSVWSS